MQNSLKLNLGAGPRRLEGYVSVDIDPKDADIVADVRDLHMIESNSADEIIAIHVIEHFYKWEVQPMLMEWRRVLKPKGKIILECPNLDFVCKAVLNGQADNLGLGGLYGNPGLKNEFHCHHWGYTPVSLMNELRLAGFRFPEVKQAQFKIPQRDMRVEATK